MNENNINNLKHSHNFSNTDKTSEKKTLYVIVLTAITMIAEITTGLLTGSMALLADGWHMGTHTLALGITYFAYVLARNNMNSDRFSFGTGKFGILAGYTSALFLGATAIYMFWESTIRFFNPVNIAFDEAIFVAIIGLIVNVISVWMLDSGNDHSHNHSHDHSHDHHNHDHNLRAAYLHVLADALTSVLAIIALLAGKFYNLVFLDPVMGIVGGILIGKWAWGLLKSSAMILLDGSSTKKIEEIIIEKILEDKDSQVIDLHVWHLSSNDLAAIISVISKQERKPSEYHSRLSDIKELKHVTIEIQTLSDDTTEEEMN